jgi:hypothetical protein
VVEAIEHWTEIITDTEKNEYIANSPNMSVHSEKVGLDRHSQSPETSTRGPSLEKDSDAVDALPQTQMDQEQNKKPATGGDDLELGDLERHLSRKSTRKVQMAQEIYPLMDIEKGLVGWDSQDDPTNPRSVIFTSFMTESHAKRITGTSPREGNGSS